MILIIDNYDSFTYNLYQNLAQFHGDFRIVRNDQILLQDIKDLNPTGIVLSPGPGRPENAGICVELIRAYINGNIHRIPLLGVCLGHQAIAFALGGRVIRAAEICHGKSDLIFHTKKDLYRACSAPFLAGRYHSLVAERKSLPKTMLVDAENKQKLVMGMRHNTFPLYGVQFHPESILTPEGVHILKTFVTMCVAKEVCS